MYFLKRQKPSQEVENLLCSSFIGIGRFYNSRHCYYNSAWRIKPWLRPALVETCFVGNLFFVSSYLSSLIWFKPVYSSQLLTIWRKRYGFKAWAPEARFKMYCIPFPWLIFTKHNRLKTRTLCLHQLENCAYSLRHHA